MGEQVRYYRNEINPYIELKECTDSVHSEMLHFHDEVSICYIESGKANALIGDMEIESSAGDLIIIPSGVAHRCTTDDRKWKFTMIYVDNKYFSDISGMNTSAIKSYRKKLTETERTDIKGVLNRLKESETGTINNFIRNKLPEFNFRENENNNISERMNRVKRYIDERYREEIGLEDISEYMCLNKYTIIREFVKIFGITPHSYLINVRLNACKRQLKNNVGIGDVYCENQFYDQSHFSKLFRRFSGVSPMEYTMSAAVKK